MTLPSDKTIDTATASEEAQDRLLEAHPVAVVADSEVPASLDALLDLHGMDPSLDSRRWTSNAPGMRKARILRDCHAGLAPILAVSTALIVNADPIHLGTAMVAGAAAALAIGRSHRAFPGRKTITEAAVGVAAAGPLAVVAITLPADTLPIASFDVTTATLLAAVVAFGATAQGIVATVTRKPIIARTCALIAAVAAVLAV